MSVRTAVGAAIAILALPGTAGAATRFVDDDGAQCRQAAYTSIQAAIDAAAPGDTIRVCAGTYREGVYVPAEKKRLKLLAVARRQARIVAPASGELPYPWALVVLAGDGVTFRGFEVEGPLPPFPGGYYAANVLMLVLAGGTIDHNGFVPQNVPSMTLGDWPCQPEWDSLYAGSDAISRLVIDRNAFHGDGIVTNSAWPQIQRNTFGPHPNTHRSAFGVVGDGSGMNVRANTFEDLKLGAAGTIPWWDTCGFDPAAYRIRGNTFRNNTVGVQVTQTTMVVAGNEFFANDLASGILDTQAHTVAAHRFPGNRYGAGQAP